MLPVYQSTWQIDVTNFQGKMVGLNETISNANFYF